MDAELGSGGGKSATLNEGSIYWGARSWGRGAADGVPRNRVALEMAFRNPVSCRALYSVLFCASFPQPCEMNKHNVAIPSQRGSGHPDPVFPKFRIYGGLIPGVEPGLTPATLLFPAGPSAFS